MTLKTVASPASADLTPSAWTVALIAAYNEDRFFGSVVLKSRQYVDTVIVVDDGSTDATAEIAQAAGAIRVTETTSERLRD